MQAACKSLCSEKGRSSLTQPDERSLAIMIDRGYATHIYVQRTRRAYCQFQVLCRRTLEASSQFDGDPAFVTN